MVAINHFVKDTDEEVNTLIELCAQINIKAVLSKGWLLGGNGTQDLAKAVVEEIEKNNKSSFKPLYDWNSDIKQKIQTVAKEIYGASEVEYNTKAEQDLKLINKLGLTHLPICMAKTQKSFSDNEKLIGRPTNFTITVREFEIAAGAGFIIPILGNMMRMPGLPSIPASEAMTINDQGIISGLS